MPLGLQIMALIGVVAAILGWPMLVSPEGVRQRLRWAPAPQLAYVFRIAGTMLVSLGAILILFAILFWRFAMP